MRTATGALTRTRPEESYLEFFAGGPGGGFLARKSPPGSFFPESYYSLRFSISGRAGKEARSGNPNTSRNLLEVP